MKINTRHIAMIATMVLPQPTSADVVVPARTLRSQSIINASDLLVQPGVSSGTFAKISDLVGLEARVVLYQGRPISISDVGPAAIIERNQSVTIVYSTGSLKITATGRALARGGVGETLKVMNSESRNIVFGMVTNDGNILVQSNSSAMN